MRISTMSTFHINLLSSICVTVEIYGLEGLSSLEVAVNRAEFKVSPSPTREVGDPKLRILKFLDRLSLAKQEIFIP